MTYKINKTFIFVFILLILSVINAVIVSAVSLTQGDVVQVINDGSIGLTVRGPNACDPQIGSKRVYNGDRGIVLDGPVTCNSYTRWKIRWSDGVEGWVPEAYPTGVDYLQKITITPSTKFNIGDHVRVNSNGVNVRNNPPVLLSIDHVNTGDLGTVIANYFYGVANSSSGFYYFWKIDFDTKTDGWVAENYLDEVISCTNQCTSGTTRCSIGSIRQMCADYNSDSCYEWGGDYNCPTGCNAYTGNCYSCTPQCSGKQCGDDSCGGSCGSCGSGQSCNANGQCVSGGSYPTSVLSPVDGALEIVNSLESCSNTKWCFNQYKTGGHVVGGGICKADDTYAWDSNLNYPTWNLDDGKPVYAVAPGVVTANYGTCINAGGGYGQLLIEHDYNGNKWWSGYLHLKNIQVTTGQTVTENTLLGYVSNVSLSSITPHLHFVVYNGTNTYQGLTSFNVNINQRNNGSTTNPYSINFDVRNMAGFNDGVINSNDILEFIRQRNPSSPMINESSIGQQIINSGLNYNVNPAFLVATAKLEGQFGTLGWALAHPECHNTMGWGIPSGSTPPDSINCMDSWGGMINRVAYFIANGSNYYNNGKYTVDQIRNTYAGEPNSQSIVNIMNDLYTFSSNCTPCVPKTCSELGKQCGGWDNGCSQSIDCGSCVSGQTCNSIGQCVTNPTCTCNSWENQGCNLGGCPQGQMSQIRTCTPTSCDTVSRCIVDSSCDSAGWKLPTATGKYENTWTNPSNALLSDNNYATAEGIYKSQDYYNFNFNIPANAVINGIEVRLEGHGEVSGRDQAIVELWSQSTNNQYGFLPPLGMWAVKNNGAGGWWWLGDGADDTFVGGSSTDLWGKTWNTSDFLNNNFLLRIKTFSNPDKIYIDNVQAKVYYTESACSQNSDCGTNGFIGGLFCSGGNVFQNYLTYTCNNPGTALSSCSSSTASQLNQNCGTNYCDSFSSNYCNSNNVYHLRTCYNMGCSSGACTNNSYPDEQLVQTCSINQICSNGICVDNSIIIPLNSGWNLISIPPVVQDNSIENVFGPIMNKVIVINSFDNGAKTYDPLLPDFSDLNSIDSMHGYWVKMNNSANLTINGAIPENKTINLATGWNLISYLCNSSKNVSIVFAPIINKVIVINGFENGALTYDPLLPEFSDLQVMKPNLGYWVKMNQSAVINYDVVC